MHLHAAGVGSRATRNIGILSASALIGNLFFDRAIWIIYLTEQGYSLLQIGLLQSVLHVTIFLFEIPTGMVADLFGRKVSLIAGRLLATLYLMGMMVADSLYTTAALFFLFGLSLAFLSGAEEALLFDSIAQSQVPEQHTSRLMGRYFSFITLGLAVAMAAGGFLREISWQMVYGFSALCQIAAIILGCALVDIGPSDKAERQTLMGHVRETIGFCRSQGAARALMLGAAIYSAAFSTYYMFAQDLLSSMALTTAAVSILFAAESLLSAGVLAKAYVIESRSSPKRVLLSSLIISAAVFPLVAIQNHVIGIAAFFILSLIYSLSQPISSSVLNSEIPSQQRATLLSVMSFISSVVIFVLFPLIGYLADRFTVNQVLGWIGFLAMAVCSGLVLFFFAVRRGRPTDIVNSVIPPSE